MRPEKSHSHIFRSEMVIPGTGCADMW